METSSKRFTLFFVGSSSSDLRPSSSDLALSSDSARVLQVRLFRRGTRSWFPVSYDVEKKHSLSSAWFLFTDLVYLRLRLIWFAFFLFLWSSTCSIWFVFSLVRDRSGSRSWLRFFCSITYLIESFLDLLAWSFVAVWFQITGCVSDRLLDQISFCSIGNF